MDIASLRRDYLLPQRNALVLPDLLSVDLAAQRGGCGRAGRAEEDKENVCPNAYRLQQKQRKLAKQRAAKKAAAAPSAAVAAAPAAASTSAAPAAPPTAMQIEPPTHLPTRVTVKNDLVSPPLAEITGRHTSFMERAKSVRSASSLRAELTLDCSPVPVVR